VKYGDCSVCFNKISSLNSSICNDAHSSARNRCDVYWRISFIII
jgi:hypothetical protein